MNRAWKQDPKHARSYKQVYSNLYLESTSSGEPRKHLPYSFGTSTGLDPIRMEDSIEDVNASFRTKEPEAEHSLDKEAQLWLDADLSGMGELEPYDWGDVDPDTIGEPIDW